MTIDIRKRPTADAISDDPPQVVVERVQPCARCHACGDGVVEAVCSHCARLLCSRHLVAAGPLGPRAVLELFRTDPKAAAAPRAGKAAANPGEKATAAAGDPGVQKSGGRSPAMRSPAMRSRAMRSRAIRNRRIRRRAFRSRAVRSRRIRSRAYRSRTSRGENAPRIPTPTTRRSGRASDWGRVLEAPPTGTTAPPAYPSPPVRR